MFKKKRQTVKEIFKKISDSAGVGKRALAITLALSILVGTLPAFGFTAGADAVTEFKVTAYDISARIDIPMISGATNYKVYYSTKNNADLTALQSDAAKHAVVDSGSYLPYDYAVNGAKDTTGRTIAISAATTYYFYLVTNDGTADTLQSSFAATTKATANCYWTSPGNYDTTWYNGSASAFTISTAKELAGLAYLTNNGNTFTGKTITLSSDIDLSANVWTPIGTWDVLKTSLQKPFAGTFDGGNKTVSGLHTNNANNYQGLFGCTSSGTIKNVGIVNGYIKGTGTVGSIVAQNSGTISDCYNTATVRGTDIFAKVATLNGTGGIAGNAYNSITNCSNTGSVSCAQEVGGVAGRAAYNRTIISGCSNAGAVSGVSYVGGIAGSAGSPNLDGTNSTIENCSNTGTISATGSVIGGIAGVSGPISNCSNTGAVSSSGLAGGIAGDACNSITGCSNTGPISGSGFLGGIAGQTNVNAAIISNCYNTASVSGGTPLVSGAADICCGGIVAAAQGSVKNCYNTGGVNNIGGYAGGIVGSIAKSTTVSNCYNIGTVSSTGKYVGGVVGYLEGSVIASYNTAAVTGGANYVGGVVGCPMSPSNPQEITYCYNTGAVSGTGSYIGGVVGTDYFAYALYNPVLSYNYYCGYSGGIGQSGTTPAQDAAGRAIPFLSYSTPLSIGETTTITELTPDKLNSAFRTAFGITAIQYPDAYESSDPGVITVNGYTVTAIADGTALVKGKAGTGMTPNANIILTQKSLNMTDTTSGFSGAEITTKGMISQPITVSENCKKSITAFSIGSNTGVIDGTNHTISVTVPFGTNVQNLIATFSQSGSSIKVGSTAQTSGTTINNFTNPVTYTVTAKDGSTQNYTVTVVVQNAPKAITGFSIGSNAGVVDEANHTIVVTVPYGTDITSQKATFTQSGSRVKVGTTVQTSGITTNNFTNPVTYTVTAADGKTQNYTVTVVVQNAPKSITGFSIGSNAGVVDEANHTIVAAVPYGTDVGNLIATFSQSGSSVKVGATDQISGTTANDFTNPVTYTVTAADGKTQDYTVTVVVQNAPKAITDFSIDSHAGVINEVNHTISVTVPYGTDVGNLIATFSQSGSSVKVGATDQISGTTANDFTNPVTYTITAADGKTQNYTVTVVVQNAPKSITDFSIGSHTGVINEANHTISVTVPKGTDVTNLIATFSQSGSSVKVGATDQTSGTTPNDFTNPITYTVTAADGNTQNYTVTVTVSENKQLQSIPAPSGITNIPNGVAKTAAALNLPSTVTLITDQGPVTANVTWAVSASSYDASKTTAQTFVVTGTVTLPAGVDANGVSQSISISVSVDAASENGGSIITGFVPLPPAIKSQTVENGADFSSLNLPQKLEVVGKDISGLFVKVSQWICSIYDSTVAGSYRFTPVLDRRYVDSGYVDSGYVIGSGVRMPEITVTVKGKPGSTHNNNTNNTSSSPSSTNGKTEIKVDRTNNTTTVTTKSDNVITNGTTTHIETNVPSVLVDNTATSTNGNTVDTAKKAAVTINLPTDDIKQQLAAKQDVELTVTVPSDVTNKNENIAVTINANREILDAAKANLSDVTIRIKDVDTQQLKYSWTFKGADLAKSTTPMTDVNIAMSVRLTTEVPKVNVLTPTNTGLVLSFDHSGVLPSVASVKFSALEKGFKPGQTLYFYYYNPTTRQIDPLGSKHTVDADGNVTVQIYHCSDYVLLPNAARSLTLDTKIYTMAVNNKYEIGIKLINTQGTSVKVYSSTKGAASIKKLKNGNYQVTGLKAGLTYIMFDVYDEKNRLIKKGHASVRLIIKNGVKPTGDSWRQTAIF